LRNERVALAFQQTNVRIVTNDDEQFAVRADFLEKANVARVKPIVTACHDDAFSAESGLGCGSLWKALKLARTQHNVAEPESLAGGLPLQVIPVLHVHPHLRSKTIDNRKFARGDWAVNWQHRG